MPYINTATSQYPVSEAQIRSEHPNVSFPDPFVPPEGYAWVFPQSQPEHDPLTHTVSEGEPELSGDQWIQTWTTTALAPEVVTANTNARNAALQAEISDAILRRMDEFAATRNYGSVLSAASYANSTVPKFKQEAEYIIQWRDQVWTTAYQILGEALAGTRPVPTVQEVLDELPVPTWPAQV